METEICFHTMAEPSTPESTEGTPITSQNAFFAKRPVKALPKNASDTQISERRKVKLTGV